MISDSHSDGDMPQESSLMPSGVSPEAWQHAATGWQRRSGRVAGTLAVMGLVAVVAIVAAIVAPKSNAPKAAAKRSEEHTSELQSPDHLVCRLLLEKKKKTRPNIAVHHGERQQRQARQIPSSGIAGRSGGLWCFEKTPRDRERAHFIITEHISARML